MKRLIPVLLVAAATSCATRPYAPSDDGQIIQAVLDHPRLAVFLHPETPGRVPVRIALPDDRSVEVSKFGQPVIVVPWPEDPGAAVVKVEQYTGQDKTAFIRLTYPVEGVVGEFHLALKDERWVVTKATVHEQ